MRKDEFLDVMGEIDDKFFKEAREYLCGDYGEIVEPVMIEPKKKSAARFVLPIAASVALVGVLGVAVFFGGRLNTTDPNAKITSDITTEAPEETTEDNNAELREAKYVDYCKEYVYEQSKDVFSRGEDPLQYRVLDLNFDGTNEILVTTEEIFCPIFVFEAPINDPESDPTFINMIGDNLYEKHKGFFEELYPYEEGKYYYYFFHTDNNGADTRALMTIKYDEEKGGYMEGLLSYGVVSYYDTVLPHETFFRNYVDVSDLTSAGEQGITESEFRELWGKHDMLPAIDDELLKGAEKAISINSDYVWAIGKSFDEVTEKFGTGTKTKYGSYRFDNRSGIFSLKNTFNGVDYDPIHSICNKILYIDAKDFLIGEFSTMNYEEFAESCGIEYISLPESNDTMDNTWNAIFSHPDYKDIVFIMSTVERDVIDETADFMIDYSAGYSGLEGAGNETGTTSSENVQRVVPQKRVFVGPSTVSFTDRYPEIPKPNYSEEFFTEMTALELCEYYGLTMVKEYLKTGDFIEITDENTRHGVYNLPDGNVYDINTFTFETPDNIIREKRVTLTVGKKSFFGQEFFPEAEYGTGKIKYDYDDYYNEDEGIFFKIFEKNGLCMMVSAKVDEIADFDEPKLKETFYRDVDANNEEYWKGVPPEFHLFPQAVYECSRTDPWDIGYDDWNPDWDNRNRGDYGQ